MSKIALSKVFLNDEARAAAIAALDSGMYVLGPESKAFESELATYFDTEQCVLTSSCTASLRLLHECMGISRGDEILVPAHTAFPTIESLMQFGARPVFIDVDETYCVDPDHLAASVTPRTVGILPVHLYGHAADVEAISSLASRHGLWTVEDCAQASGARYKGEPVGSFGHASVLSFYPSKNLAVPGDGGAVCTDDEALADQIRILRNHGRHSKYLHEKVGYNLRFNEIQAAVGRVALAHLDALNDHRRRVAAYYDRELAGLVTTPVERDWARHVYHMYVIRCDVRDDLAAFLKSHGIATGIHYPVPNHRQPAVVDLYGEPEELPETDHLVDEILSLPMHGELPMEDVARVCECIHEFFRG